MTPEAQNIALAEACGWRPDGRDGYWINHEQQHLTSTENLPDFFRDLNAQFEAWQKLTDEQKFAFRSFVREIAWRENVWAEEAQARFGCECLLRAVGKWIE